MLRERRGRRLESGSRVSKAAHSAFEHICAVETMRTVLRDQTWNRFWNRLSPKALQRRRSAPSKSLKVRVLQHMLPGC